MYSTPGTFPVWGTACPQGGGQGSSGLHLDLTLDQESEGLVPHRMTGVGDRFGLKLCSRCGWQL